MERNSLGRISYFKAKGSETTHSISPSPKLMCTHRKGKER